jgi:aminoglycoside phosphotransferase (APT) family kinase protein
MSSGGDDLTGLTELTELTEHELGAIANVLSEAAAVKGPLSARRVAGGRSNRTFVLTDDVSAWVLRTPPRTGRTPSAHDVGREYRVTSALAPAGVPVPPPVLFHPDEDLIGGPFAVAEFVPGATIQSRDQLHALGTAPGTGPGTATATATAAIKAAAEELVAVLAALHHVDHTAAGLGDFGKPGGYAQRQLRRWSGQWELVGPTELNSLAQEVIRRLLTSLPRQRAVSVVHGDFRIDNTILDLADSARPRVAAIVDWELSTIGDPVADVALMCAYRAPAFDLVVGAPSAWTSDRLPPAPALAAAYEAAGGVALTDWNAHLTLAYFKIAVIAAGIDYRYRLGAASGPGFDTAGQSVEDFLELGRAVLRRPS